MTRRLSGNAQTGQLFIWPKAHNRSLTVRLSQGNIH